MTGNMKISRLPMLAEGIILSEQVDLRSVALCQLAAC
jgi:hypothetical protein